MIYSIANENLAQTWSKSTSGVTGPDRSMYAPLYLDVSGIGVQTQLPLRFTQKRGEQRDRKLLLTLTRNISTFLT